MRHVIHALFWPWPGRLLYVWAVAACWVWPVVGPATAAPDRPRRFDAEFALPAYVNMDTASLVVQRKSPASAPLRLVVHFAERTNGHVPRGPAAVAIPPGQISAALRVAISDWPDGEYLAAIRLQGVGPASPSHTVRVLHKQTIQDPAPAPEPIDVKGSRTLFVDDWYVAESAGLRRRVHQAETWPVTTGMIPPDRRKQNPTELAMEPDGSVVVAFTAFNPRRSERTRYLARTRDLVHWRIKERGEARPIDLRAQRSRVGTRWRWYDPTGKKAKYRMYEPEHDGPVDLRQVHVQYSGWSKKATRWGDMGIPPRSTFPIWRKSPDQFLVLTDRPLTTDKWSMGENDLGEWSDTNDNWGGQWLSADGSTLHFCQARVIPRHPPFRVPYDNIMGSRILVVWSTSDGRSWTPTYLTVPTDTDPIGLQSYGAYGFWAEGQRLRMAYHSVYDQARQQVAQGMLCSRDGVSWTRLGGGERFVPNGPLGSWNFGLVVPMHAAPLERDGSMYHLLMGINAPHFYLWTAHGAPGVSVPYLKHRFGGEHALDAWPYWPAFGSWDALTEHLRRGSYTVGLMRHRRDGWVSLCPKQHEGRLTTKLLRHSRRLALNARTEPDGFVRVEVLDPAGRELPPYCRGNAAVFKGDSVSHRLKWAHGQHPNMPNGPVRLRITICRADLFALEW